MTEDEKLEELIDKAQLHSQNRQWHEALAAYHQAIAVSPENVELYFQRCRIHLELKDLTGALDDYNLILKIQPDNSKAWLEKGFLLGFRQENISEAIACLTEVSHNSTLKPVASLYLGILYYNAKRFQEAETEFNIAVNKNPQFAAAYFYRGQLREINKQYLEAVEDYETAIKLGHNFKEIFFRLSLTYARLKDFKMIKEQFMRSHSKAPYTTSSVHEFSCHYFNDGRPASTENIFPDPIQIEYFGDFLNQGYVRSINHYFRHNCPGCNSCVPLRVLTEKFYHSKSMKRTYKQNSDLRMEVLESPVMDEVRVKLFEKYYREKHNHHDQECLEQDIAFRHFGFRYSYELDFYLGDKLIAVHIVDVAKDSFYAAYLYYDTDYMKRRLGVYCISTAIELAASLGKPFYYMGWYIEELPVMSYKKQFRPNQLLIDGQWKDFC